MIKLPGVASATIIALAAGLFHSQMAHADCEALSRYGIYDISTSTTDTQRSQAFRRLFCQQNFETSTQASDFGLSLGVPVDSVPLNLGIDSSSNNFKESYSKFCDNQSYDSSMAQKTISFVKTINASVIQSLNLCLTQAGLHARLEQGADGINFRFYTKYVASSDLEQWPTVKDFVISGATCDNPPEVDAKVTPAGWETLCRRQASDKEVLIAFNASSTVIKDTPLSLAPVANPPQPKPPEPRQPIAIKAVNFVNGKNVAPAGGLVGTDGAYGEVLLNAPPYTGRPNAAEWEINSPGGRYRLHVQYAAAASRPVVIIVNGQQVLAAALAEPTGCWAFKCQSWATGVVEVTLKSGPTKIRFERGGVFPHLSMIRLIPL